MSLVQQGVELNAPAAPVTPAGPSFDQRFQILWARYSKPFLIGFGAAVLLGLGYLAYQKFVVEPKQVQATEQMFKAEQYFAQDSFALALNGAAGSKGFKFIASEYGATKAGTTAKYYAGICELKLGNYKNAVDYLSDFSTDAKQVQMMAYGALADAQSELKNVNDAVSNYKKAAAHFPKDETNASEYLFRAALLSEINGKNDEAVRLYKELRDKFPRTEKGYQADKYLYRLSAEKNEFSVK